MPLNTVIDLSITGTSQKAPVIGNTPTDTMNFRKRMELLTGVGAGQADKLYYAERVVNASSNDDLDLTGTLVDNLGVTFTIARIKLLAVLAEPSDPNATRNTNNVILGAAAANQWAPLLGAAGTITLRPGCMSIPCWVGSLDATGYAVTGGTGDIFRVANSGAGTQVSYQIIIVAASA